jgi:hypothetical protein
VYSTSSPAWSFFNLRTTAVRCDFAFETVLEVAIFTSPHIGSFSRMHIPAMEQS